MPHKHHFLGFPLSENRGLSIFLLVIICVVYCHSLVASAELLSDHAVVDFCAGKYMACALFANKKIKCWGLETTFGEGYNMLGASMDTIGSNIPYIDVGTNGEPKKISCGYDHVCILFNTNIAKCIGHNQKGQIGIGVNAHPVGIVSGHKGDNLPAVNVGSFNEVQDIVAGEMFTLGMLKGFGIKAFGLNDHGQLGLENKTDRAVSPDQLGMNLPYTPIFLDSNILVMFASSSAAHACVCGELKPTSQVAVKCWGNNKDYQLGHATLLNKENVGDDPNEMGENLPFLDFGKNTQILGISLGSSHTCVLLLRIGLRCFGRGEYGQLGSGSLHSIVQIAGDLPFIPTGISAYRISSGEHHTCVITFSGAKCFGLNSDGQLGQGDDKTRGESPTTMIPYLPYIDFGANDVQAIDVRCGSSFTCVLLNNTRIKCFGWNLYGQLAIGNIDSIGDAAFEMGSNLKYSMLFDSDIPTLDLGLVVGLSVVLPLIFIGFIVAAVFFGRKHQNTNKNPTNHIQNQTELSTPAQITVQTSMSEQLSDPASLKLVYAAPAKSNSIAVPSVLEKKYIAMISYFKPETGVIASLMVQESTFQMQKMKVKDSVMFIDEVSQNNQIVSERVQESKVVVALLSKSYFDNIRCLLEWFYAFEYAIPIVLINIPGSGFDADNVKAKLSKLNEETIGAELIEMGIDINIFASKVIDKLICGIMNKYDPNDQKRIRDVQIEIIVEHIIKESKL